ncbi:MAG: acetyl-CoA carboxylase carboxyltransferase subunit beta [Gammaproteobacteria bacterium]|nr:acetyl-CoA carboxylase carboxyltransferase subunit beta [Gammaproteobacteria bacterium]
MTTNNTTSNDIVTPTSMNWQQRAVPKLEKRIAAPAPRDHVPVVICPSCGDEIVKSRLFELLYVCPHCDEHLKMSARMRLETLFDHVEAELGQEFVAGDPLHFVDSQPYPERMKAMQKKTGESEALIAMQGRLNQLSLVACAFEFDFMGGSMGSVVGDRFVLAAETALKARQPLVCFAASGGARMQEGLLSLMQMARTAAAIQRLKEAGIPYIVVLTHPVYGGVTASLAMLGDIHLSEPKAMIGFAGKRVIEQTVREVLKEPFQRAEYLLDHGVVDQIVHRHEMKATIERLLNKLLNISVQSGAA